ncbi:hypothetical protein [Kibdelosporangium banguiense]|uniref:hypothetical protein n=1 Tax=Kibdelosporangium banguiense TaxID=1365924 RepID=UPI001AE9666C|nr:hypothetical protein [Kibdelosporangium banguiense]
MGQLDTRACAVTGPASELGLGVGDRRESVRQADLRGFAFGGGHNGGDALMLAEQPVQLHEPKPRFPHVGAGHELRDDGHGLFTVPDGIGKSAPPGGQVRQADQGVRDAPPVAGRTEGRQRRDEIGLRLRMRPARGQEHGGVSHVRHRSHPCVLVVERICVLVSQYRVDQAKQRAALLVLCGEPAGGDHPLPGQSLVTIAGLIEQSRYHTGLRADDVICRSRQREGSGCHPGAGRFVAT